MKRFSEQLHKKAMTVKLRVAERKELRERVVSYMEYHPLPAEMKQTRVIKEPKLLTEEYRSVVISFKMLSRWAVGVAALMIVVVPLMAERSVPGDGLYAVKRFNEDVRSTLSFNTIQKVEWETELLNRRIAEARLLKSEGRLTDEVEAEVANAVRTHSDNAQKNIEVLRTEDADEATLASIALETTLTVQSAALSDEEEVVINETGEETSSVKPPSVLAVAVEESRMQTNATNEASTIPAFDKLMAKLEINTTRVYELRDSLKSTISAEQKTEITRRLQDIERSVAEAIANKSASEESDVLAREMLVNSLQRTQKLIVFMTEIEVSQTVDIEEIVPVVLTHQEEKDILIALETELNEKTAQINEALPATDDEGVMEKSTLALEEAETIMSGLASSADFESSESILLSALALVNDVFVLLELDKEEEVVVPEIPEGTGSSTEEVASSTDEVLEEQVASSTDEAVDEEAEEPVATTTDLSTEQVDTEGQI